MGCYLLPRAFLRFVPLLLPFWSSSSSSSSSWCPPGLSEQVFREAWAPDTAATPPPQQARRIHRIHSRTQPALGGWPGAVGRADLAVLVLVLVLVLLQLHLRRFRRFRLSGGTFNHATVSSRTLASRLTSLASRKCGGRYVYEYRAQAPRTAKERRGGRKLVGGAHLCGAPPPPPPLQIPPRPPAGEPRPPPHPHSRCPTSCRTYDSQQQEILLSVLGKSRARLAVELGNFRVKTTFGLSQLTNQVDF